MARPQTNPEPGAGEIQGCDASEVLGKDKYYDKL